MSGNGKPVREIKLARVDREQAEIPQHAICPDCEDGWPLLNSPIKGEIQGMVVTTMGCPNCGELFHLIPIHGNIQTPGGD